MSLKEAHFSGHPGRFTLPACLQNWEISAGERADAAGSQRFINDTITLEDLANVRVPASRTDLPDYRMPEYKTWNNRLLGLIGVSVVGEDYIRGQEGWTKVRAILAAKDEELPDKLYSWMEELKEHLSREWYGTPEAKWWLQWLKDFQERVQTVSKRWGFVTAGRYIVRWYFLLLSSTRSSSLINACAAACSRLSESPESSRMFQRSLRLVSRSTTCF